MKTKLPKLILSLLIPILLLLTTPFSIENKTLVYGFPLWAVLSLAVTLFFAIYLIVLIEMKWFMFKDKESLDEQ
jgi:hypothetical protein